LIRFVLHQTELVSNTTHQPRANSEFIFLALVQISNKRLSVSNELWSDMIWIYKCNFSVV
jgi:hypothetical protein